MYTTRTKNKWNKLHFANSTPKEQHYFANSLKILSPKTKREIFTLAYIELGRGHEYFNWNKMYVNVIDRFGHI